ncbi:MAG: radical SAM protein [Dehalococcoidia bacterium]|jgi:MoaA/NifB/PqqE/SkfB family radical SAM enzyme
MAVRVEQRDLLADTTVFPIGFHWDITEACNFRCNFCLTNSGKRAPNELSYSQKRELIDRLFTLGVIFIRILGGEPLLPRDTIKVMEYAVSRGMQLAFSTNGSLLTEETVSRLAGIKRGIRYIQVSIYGSSPATMAETTRTKGQFDKVRHGMELLNEHEMPFTVLSVLCQENMHDIIPTYRYAKSMGAENFKLVPKSDTGRGREDNSFRYIRDKAEWSYFVEILRQLAELQNQGGPPVFFQARPLFGQYIQDNFGIAYYHSLCEGGVHYLYGNASGQLAPCPFLKNIDLSYVKNPVGEFPYNALEDNLLEVWDSAEFNYFRRLFKLEKNAEYFNENCPYLRNGECRPCILTGCQCLPYIRRVKYALG